MSLTCKFSIDSLVGNDEKSSKNIKSAAIVAEESDEKDEEVESDEDMDTMQAGGSDHQRDNANSYVNTQTATK
jgi:hypothetical protein